MEAIPVTERLPNSHEGLHYSASVLAFSAHYGAWHTAYVERLPKHLERWINDSTGLELRNVTHWQPLPQSPSAPRVEQPPSVPTLPGVVVPVSVEERLPGDGRDVAVYSRAYRTWLFGFRTALGVWYDDKGEALPEDIDITHWYEKTPRPEDDLDTDLLTVLAAIGAEVARARSMWPAFNTLHEGYAIIAEELDEVWQHVKVKQGKRDSAEVRKELLETAAMCVRAVLDLQHTGFNK